MFNATNTLNGGTYNSAVLGEQIRITRSSTLQ